MCHLSIVRTNLTRWSQNKWTKCMWNGMVWDDVIFTPCTNIPCKIYSKHFKSLKSIIYAVDLNAKVPKQLLPIARCCVFIKLFVVTLTSYSNRFSVKWRPCLPLPLKTVHSLQKKPSSALSQFTKASSRTNTFCVDLKNCISTLLHPKPT